MGNISRFMKAGIKLNEEANKYKYYCECGHPVVIYPMEHRTKKVCSWCGHYVYINEKEKFKDEIRRKLWSLEHYTQMK